MRFAILPAVAATLFGIAACGSSSSSSSSASSSSGSHGGGSVVFTGDIAGTWTKMGEVSESTCKSDAATVHIGGPASGDEGDLTVKSDGSVSLDAEKYGDFSATSGGTLHASKGFDINADIATARGKTAHVSGSLTC